MTDRLAAMLQRVSAAHHRLDGRGRLSLTVNVGDGFAPDPTAPYYYLYYWYTPSPFSAGQDAKEVGKSHSLDTVLDQMDRFVEERVRSIT